ncbi:MAG: hypothetical protein IH602_06310 [Bryobacteraceae bacterium]|nr:hypothetical protein [Bryobacteraceae bacterium]
MGRAWVRAAMVAVLAMAGTASAANFEDVARNVEQRLGMSRTRMPGVGFLVNSFVKVSRPAGASAMKLAIFERENGRYRPEVFQAAVKEASDGWSAVVQVSSPRDREEVAMYVRPAGNKWELLIATSDPAEGTLVYLKIPGRDLLAWLSDKTALREGLGTGVQ